MGFFKKRKEIETWKRRLWAWEEKWLEECRDFLNGVVL